MACFFCPGICWCCQSFPLYLLWLKLAIPWWLMKFLNSLCLSAIWICSFVNDYSCLFPFFHHLFVILVWRSSLYFQDTSLLWVLRILNIFSHLVSCLVTSWCSLLITPNFGSVHLSTSFLTVIFVSFWRRLWLFHVCRDILLSYLQEASFFCLSHTVLTSNWNGGLWRRYWNSLKV